MLDNEHHEPEVRDETIERAGEILHDLWTVVSDLHEVNPDTEERTSEFDSYRALLRTLAHLRNQTSKQALSLAYDTTVWNRDKHATLVRHKRMHGGETEITCVQETVSGLIGKIFSFIRKKTGKNILFTPQINKSTAHSHWPTTSGVCASMTSSLPRCGNPSGASLSRRWSSSRYLGYTVPDGTQAHSEALTAHAQKGIPA